MTDIEEKLNKLATGQLNEQEAHEVKALLEQDAELKLEYEFISALHKGFKQDDITAPGEMGLARLKRDIEREQAQAQQTVNAHKPEVTPKQPQRVWKPLAIAACCLLALQVMLYIPIERGGSAPDMVPLSGGVSAQPASLQIVFKEDATAVQIHQALSAVQATIVNGPGALGIYSLALPAGSDTQQISSQLSETHFIEEVLVIRSGEH